MADAAGRAALGVLGGGQLGRMFVQAAQSMGYTAVVLEPDAHSPAGQVAHMHVASAYDDEAGLARLEQLCAAVTTEFENVPAHVLERLARCLPVAPAAGAVAVCQDRALEKARFVSCGVPCAPHTVVSSAQDFASVDPSLLPGILKTARLGYDGKGQVRVSGAAALEAAWQQLGRVTCVLEKLLPLAHEISVIVARGRDGHVVHLPVQHNLHRDGILAVTEVPAAAVDAGVQQRAVDAASRIASSLDYVGVLCVEFFVLQDGSLVANEMAPRPHNSGHYSIDACDVSQFELQVRCLAGLPLTPPRLHSCAVMLNLLGDAWLDGQGRERAPAWDEVLAVPGVHLHLYGKSEVRSGRKMGHVTITAASPGQARAAALQVARILGLPAF